MAPIADCYLRVSTIDQHPENQRRSVEALARARGLDPRFTVEKQSAVKERPGFDAILRRVLRRETQAIVCWALDRLSRGGIGATLKFVEQCDAHGVRLFSVQEPWLEMQGPARDLLLSVMAWCAQQERARIVERTRAGLARARERGVILGRPPRKDRAAKVAQAVALRRAGESWQAIGRRLGVPVATARRWGSENVTPASKG